MKYETQFLKTHFSFLLFSYSVRKYHILSACSAAPIFCISFPQLNKVVSLLSCLKKKKESKPKRSMCLELYLSFTFFFLPKKKKKVLPFSFFFWADYSYRSYIRPNKGKLVPPCLSRPILNTKRNCINIGCQKRDKSRPSSTSDDI